MDDAYLNALKQECEYMTRCGFTDRAAQVQTEIDRVTGVEPAAPAVAVAPPVFERAVAPVVETRAEG